MTTSRLIMICFLVVVITTSSGVSCKKEKKHHPRQAPGIQGPPGVVGQVSGVPEPSMAPGIQGPPGVVGQVSGVPEPSMAPSIQEPPGVVGQVSGVPEPSMAPPPGIQGPPRPPVVTDVVFSVDGGQVLPNVPYYISFMSADYNMWICRMNPSSSDPKTCPHQPVMFTRPTIAPEPVMFILPPSTPDTVIRESTKLSIKFVNPSQCGESGVWRVANGEVVLGGVEGREDSLFRIHMTDSYYMFTIGESVYPDVYETSISLSNSAIGKDRLMANSGELEVLFFQHYPPEYNYY
ncbi:kunitz trypsin inhibitor 7-like isoform X3 [Raphanus sativus]|uniref:Kunitz trypsin inhibitor 7-like isoform X3 n=1 Tax=Raphanus sativus TaxID=3726 RepID=A0A6J0L5H2_RAPSA|nr:kunitz trypsin inhibitor 7-like isoform X3 [Raphanus sativus]